MPGPINSVLAEGTNYLLKNGARLVSSVDDILEELGYEIGSKDGNGHFGTEVPVGGTQEEQKIIDALRTGPLDFDKLVESTGLPAGKLGAVLTVMEMGGSLYRDGLTVALCRRRGR